LRRAETISYKHAYFDCEDMSELTTRISRERGVDLDIAFHCNDRRTQVPPPVNGSDPVPGQPGEALARCMETAAMKTVAKETAAIAAAPEPQHA
jgi:hypothetical protein